MKSKSQRPKFDKEGYQTNISDLNDEPLPDLSKAEILSRAAARLPKVSAVRAALGTLDSDNPATYAATRSRAGLTQEEFASTIGVNLSTYRQWEHGRRKPSGPARALMRLLAKKPSLIQEIRKTG